MAGNYVSIVKINCLYDIIVVNCCSSLVIDSLKAQFVLRGVVAPCGVWQQGATTPCSNV